MSLMWKLIKLYSSLWFYPVMFLADVYIFNAISVSAVPEDQQRDNLLSISTQVTRLRPLVIS